MDKCFDIHSHLVPNVDDGAVDMAMSMEMLALYSSQHITHIVATPHHFAFMRYGERTRAQFDLLCEQAKKSFPEITLVLGAEVLFTPYDIEDTLASLRAGVVPSLNGSRYVLTEFYPEERQSFVRQTVQRLIEENWIPVIAHAERIRPSFADLAFAREMVQMGALLQINAYSLGKEQNPDTRGAARQLLQNGLMHFVGSDAHRMTHRPPDVAAGVAYIRANCPNAQDILYGNAQRGFGKEA